MATALTFERPLSVVDLVIFSIRDKRLRVLLVQRPEGPEEPFPGLWALPGGFVDVDRDATLEACALRKLKEKTGVEAPYLEQLGSWGSRERDPRGWSATHVYLSLVATPATGHWAAIDGARVKEKLAFDHAEILRAGLERLRSKVEYTSLPAYLMPSEFTLSDLQQVYEVVLGRTLEKKAFRKRVLATELLETVPRVRSGSNRPAQLYRLKHRRRPVFFARTFSPRGD